MSTTQCISCVHYRGSGECDAFPQQIPHEILNGEHDHTTPFPGDNGIQWEPLQVKGGTDD